MLDSVIGKRLWPILHRSAVKTEDLDILLKIGQEAGTAPLITSTIHGLPHWCAVSETGARICSLPGNSDARSDVVVVFGLVHDCRRFDDCFDPDHGPRAAEMVSKSRSIKKLLGRDGADLLARACEGHTHVLHSEDPTIGTCWDADRFCLTRLGATPDPKFFSRRYDDQYFQDLCDFSLTANNTPIS